MRSLARHPSPTVPGAFLFEPKPEKEYGVYQQLSAGAWNHPLYPSYLLLPALSQSCRPSKLDTDKDITLNGKTYSDHKVLVSISADILQRLSAQRSFDCKP